MKKLNNFVIELTSSYNFVSIFAQNFLKEIRPSGECREGKFSDVETDIPFTGEVTSDGDWSYDQYDYTKGVKFLSYKSCTQSEVIVTNFMNSCQITGKNVGINTLQKICDAAKATFSEINEISQDLIKHHFSKLFYEFEKLEEMIEVETETK